MRRQQSNVDLLLMFLEPGDVGKTVQGDPVGAQGNGFFNSVLKALPRLARQPVDQIKIDRDEIQFAAPLVEFLDDSIRLAAVHLPLNILIEILDTHGNAVKAERAQFLNFGFVDGARIDLDGDLAGGVDVEIFLGRCVKALDLGFV